MNSFLKKFSVLSPLDAIRTDEDIRLFDVHVHFHTKHFSKEFVSALHMYNITHMMAITKPKIKMHLEKNKLADNITFCYFLSSSGFTKFKSQELISQVHEAKEQDFKALKIFFGPRLWQFSKFNEYYKINDERLSDIYGTIADADLPVLIHVSDPDIWYEKRYTNVKKYGTKSDRIADFLDLVEKYPKIQWISAHFGCLPENLPKLSTLLDSYPNLFIDAGSTKWMVRELGKDVQKTKAFIEKYQDKILWGSDIANFANLGMLFSKKKREVYWYSRFWSHRLFWETSYEADLAFKDSDNPEGTKIYGLNLSKDILTKIYFTNAQKLLNGKE